MASKIEMGWEVIDGEVRIFTSLHCRRYQWRSEKTGATVIFYYGIHRKTVKRFNPLQEVSVSRLSPQNQEAPRGVSVPCRGCLFPDSLY